MSELVEKESQLPQVVVVLTTQWRASALSVAGDPNARTPHLDALARESVWLKQAVTPHPFGVFARAAFLTGTFCPRNGVSDYYDPLPADSRTLAHAFGELGYETAFFGKWQLYIRDPEAPIVGDAHARVVVPEERRGGFDFWEGFESGFLLNDPLLHGSKLAEPTRFAGYQSSVLIDRYESFSNGREKGRPLFSVISLDAPHPPYAAPADGVSPQAADSIRLLEGTTDDPNLRAEARRELAGYYAHIEATDQAIGRLIQGIKERGEWERTLFVFTSVHGDMHGYAGKFRKGWPQEPSVGVPMMISWPGKLTPREDGRLLFSLSDLGPSLLGLVGGAENEVSLGVDGQDLAGELCDENLPGPAIQEISMPSVPPFAKQCPYVWKGNRVLGATHVFPEGGEAFSLSHEGSDRFQ